MKFLNAVWTFHSSKKKDYVVYIKNIKLMQAWWAQETSFKNITKFTDFKFLKSVYKYTFN